MDNSRRGSRAPSRSLVIADDLREAIATGVYPSGTRLPPEPLLAQQAGVSRGTLREALKLLEREGLVMRRQRRGTTVSARPFLRNSLERNRGVREMIEASGKVHGIRDAQIRFVSASESLARALNLAVGDRLTVLERKRMANGQPVVLTIDHVDSAIVASATAPLLEDVSFYRWLREHCGLEVAYGVARVAAILTSPELAERLEVDAGAPIFKLSQVDYTSEGRPVLHSEEFHVADAFEISVVRVGPYA